MNLVGVLRSVLNLPRKIRFAADADVAFARPTQLNLVRCAGMHAYFKTEKFRQNLDDDEIDEVVLGEDCIAWLGSKLNDCTGIATERPIFEDWGWTMALSVDGEVLSGDPAIRDVRWSELPP